jgi:hypothetical protein
MNKFIAICAFALALPMATPAHASIKCDKVASKKKKKCEKKFAKSIGKMRKGSTALKPSEIGGALAYLNANNPLDTDDFYVGVKKIGIKEVDALSTQVAKVAATVKLAKYIKHLNQNDKAAAKKLAAGLLPHLIALKDEAPKVIEMANELGAKAQDIVKSPMDIPKVIGAVAKSVATTTKAIGDLPGALAAIGPIAGASAGAAMNAAKGAASGAAGDAMDKAKGAVGQ